MSDPNNAPSPRSSTSRSGGTEDQEFPREEEAQPSPSSQPAAYTGAEYQIASLAGILAAGTFRDGVASRWDDMSHPRYDDLFYGALRRAQWMLEKTSSPDDDIDAYRLFQEGEVHSAADIAETFKTCGWKGFSINQVKPLLGKIRTEMKELPKSLGATSGKALIRAHNAAIARIRKSFRELEKDEIVRSSFRGFGRKSERFVRGLDRRPIGRYGVATMIDNDWHRPFLEWCFFGDSKSPKYRPHEIFRFAAMQELFPERLRESHSKLNPRFHPFPPRDLEFFTFSFFEDSLIDDASSV